MKSPRSRQSGAGASSEVLESTGFPPSRRMTEKGRAFYEAINVLSVEIEILKGEIIR
jgi:hypothetical protein